MPVNLLLNCLVEHILSHYILLKNMLILTHPDWAIYHSVEECHVKNIHEMLQSWNSVPFQFSSLQELGTKKGTPDISLCVLFDIF